MSSFGNMPIEKKLRLAMVLTSAVAVLVACSVFLTLQYLDSRNNLGQTMRTIAQMTADNSTAALAFGDEEAAAEILSALRAEQQVVAAALWNAEGEILASYQAGTDTLSDEVLQYPPGTHIFAGNAYVIEPVLEGDRRLGTLRMKVSLAEMRGRTRAFGLVVLVVLLCSIVVSWFLASVIRRVLAKPVLELSRIASSITQREDWSLRAQQYGNDELGQLTLAFNRMLERTQQSVVALQDSEAQLRLVTDYAPVYLTRLDRDLRLRFMNRLSADYVGIVPGQCVGRQLEELIGAEELESLRPYLKKALGGESVQFELEVDHPQQGRRWMQINYVPDVDLEGTVIGIVSVRNDITDRRQAEQEIAHARDEAIAASRAKDDFLASLSHELRTPLNPVLLLASEAAEDPELPRRVRADFETIRHNVEMEARLIDDLLDLTRIVRGKLALTRECLDLHQVIDTALVSVRPEVEEKQITIQIDCCTEQHHVLGDAARLPQVFWNIFRNAVKFTPEGGHIVVESEMKGEDRILVRCRDTGIGMTVAELQRVFDSFTQGDHAESGPHRFGGLGLGLALARMLVRLHGGEIHADSAGPGKGSTIWVELPLAPTETAKEAERAAAMRTISPARGRTTPDPATRTRILLVEDHTPTRQALEILLTRRGYEITSAASTEEALAKAESLYFDLLVTDIGLPDRDGYSLMRTLRLQQPDLTGIALSGYGMEEDIARSRAAGFSAHLIKPINASDLDQTIAELMP